MASSKIRSIFFFLSSHHLIRRRPNKIVALSCRGENVTDSPAFVIATLISSYVVLFCLSSSDIIFRRPLSMKCFVLFLFVLGKSARTVRAGSLYGHCREGERTSLSRSVGLFEHRLFFFIRALKRGERSVCVRSSVGILSDRVFAFVFLFLGNRNTFASLKKMVVYGSTNIDIVSFLCSLDSSLSRPVCVCVCLVV